jgi:hypothetical protein
VERACICRDVVLVPRIIRGILVKIKKIFWPVFVMWGFWKFLIEGDFSRLEAPLYGTWMDIIRHV